MFVGFKTTFITLHDLSLYNCVNLYLDVFIMHFFYTSLHISDLKNAVGNLYMVPIYTNARSYVDI